MNRLAPQTGTGVTLRAGDLLTVVGPPEAWEDMRSLTS